MSSINIWLENSLLIKIFYLMVNPEILEESFIYKMFKKISQCISRCFKGSFLSFFFNNDYWERTAIKESRFTRGIYKLFPFIDKTIDFINSCIHYSFPYRTVKIFQRKIVELPFATLCYCFLPAMIGNTVFKTIATGVNLKSIALRSAIMLLLFSLSYIRLSLAEILSKSFFRKIIDWFSDKKLKDLTNDNYFKYFTIYEKISLMIPSIIFGIMLFYFPKTTLIKLIGIIYVSAFIYINPEIGMAMAIFLLPLTQTLYTIGIISITFISMILNKDRFKLDIPTAFIPAVFFIIMAILATAFSIMKRDSFRTLPLYFAYFIFFYTASIMFKNQKTLRRSIVCLFFSVSLVSLYGIYQYFFVKIPTAIAWVDVNQFPELSTRVYSTLENPNVLAEYLGLLIPLILGYLWITKGLGKKIVILATLALATLCLILTFSRGAWVGLALSILVFATLKEPRLFILLFIGSLVVPMFLPPVIIDRIASIGSLEDSSNAFRISIWIASIRMIKDYWLTGLGLGLSAFSRVYRDYMLAGTPAVHSHNLYLQIGLEMGVAGIIAIIWMVSRGLSLAITGLKKIPWSFLQAGIISALVGHLLHGLFDYVWYSPKIVMTFWLLFGIMSAMSSTKVVKNEQESMK